MKYKCVKCFFCNFVFTRMYIILLQNHTFNILRHFTKLKVTVVFLDVQHEGSLSSSLCYLPANSFL